MTIGKIRGARRGSGDCSWLVLLLVVGVLVSGCQPGENPDFASEDVYRTKSMLRLAGPDPAGSARVLVEIDVSAEAVANTDLYVGFSFRNSNADAPESLVVSHRLLEGSEVVDEWIKPDPENPTGMNAGFGPIKLEECLGGCSRTYVWEVEWDGGSQGLLQDIFLIAEGSYVTRPHVPAPEEDPDHLSITLTQIDDE